MIRQLKTNVMQAMASTLASVHGALPRGKTTNRTNHQPSNSHRWRWLGWLMLLPGWLIIITALTLWQRHQWQWPWPSSLLTLWQQGNGPEMLMSISITLIVILLVLGMKQGGYWRWLASWSTLLLSTSVLGLTFGLAWFRYHTQIPIVITPWSVVGLWRLFNPTDYGPLFQQSIGVAIAITDGFAFLLIALVRHRDTHLGDARFATGLERHRANLHAKQGIHLGKIHGQPLTLGGYESVLVVAPTGSGKSTCIAIPNLFTWQDSVVVNDMKGELYRTTGRYRAQQLKQTCYVFAPSQGEDSPHGYNPFALVRWGTAKAWQDIQLIAHLLIPDSPKEARFWPITARECFMLCVLYLHAKEQHCTLGSLYHLTRREDFLEWMQCEWEERTLDCPEFYRYAASLLQCDEKTRANILKDFQSRMDVFSDPLLHAATERHDIDLRQLRKTPLSVYVQFSESDQQRLKSLLTLFWAQLVAVMTEKEVNIQEEPHGVLLLLDEFGNLANIPALQTGVSFLRSYRVRALMMVQYLAQLKAIYGSYEANAFLNSKVKVIFALNQEEDARWASQQLGNQTIKLIHHSTSSGHGDQAGSSSYSSQYQAKPLLSPDQIMRLPKDKLIVLMEGQYPMKAKKTPWYRKKTFCRWL